MDPATSMIASVETASTSVTLIKEQIDHSDFPSPNPQVHRTWPQLIRNMPPTTLPLALRAMTDSKPDITDLSVSVP